MDHDDAPKWQKIVTELRQRISSGELAPGARLPSRPEIMSQYGVSDGVAKQVARALIGEGLAEARSGSGTYVRGRREPEPMVRAWYRTTPYGSPFRADVERQGHEATWSYSSRTVQAPADIRRRLQLPDAVGDDEDAVRTDYVYRADGEPVQLATSYEPLSLTRGTPIVLPEEGLLAGRGVAERMLSIGVVIDDWVEEVRARLGTAEECAALREPPASVVLAIRRTYFAGERPVETAEIVFSSDRYLPVYSGRMGSAER